MDSAKLEDVNNDEGTEMDLEMKKLLFGTARRNLMNTDFNRESIMNSTRVSAIPEELAEALQFNDDPTMNIFLRIRPFSQTEMNSGANNKICYYIPEENGKIVTIPPDTSNMARNNKKAKTEYMFTQVFGGGIDQATFFRFTLYGQLEKFFLGDHQMIFTYGVTGSGKTYTLLGKENELGVLPRSLDIIFNTIESKIIDEQTCLSMKDYMIKPDMFDNLILLNKKSQRSEEIQKRNTLLNTNCGGLSDVFVRQSSQSSRANLSSGSTSSIAFSDIEHEDMMFQVDDIDFMKFNVWISFVEIYNDMVYDLLQPESRVGTRPLQALQDGKKTYIRNVNEVPVFSNEQAYSLLAYGQRNLRYAETQLNHQSSRSHCIFTLKLITIHTRMEKASLTVISFCDLAGAERFKKTNATGLRMKEGQNINRDLHYLNDVIQILRNNHKLKSANTSGKYHPAIVPYRNCKLTRMMKNFFEGFGRATLIVNISPLSTVYDETLQVLRFASTAKNVISKVDKQHAVEYHQDDISVPSSSEGDEDELESICSEESYSYEPDSSGPKTSTPDFTSLRDPNMTPTTKAEIGIPRGHTFTIEVNRTKKADTVFGGQPRIEAPKQPDLGELSDYASSNDITSDAKWQEICPFEDMKYESDPTARKCILLIADLKNQIEIMRRNEVEMEIKLREKFEKFVESMQEELHTRHLEKMDALQEALEDKHEKELESAIEHGRRMEREKLNYEKEISDFTAYEKAALANVSRETHRRVTSTLKEVMNESISKETVSPPTTITKERFNSLSATVTKNTRATSAQAQYAGLSENKQSVSGGEEIAEELKDLPPTPSTITKQKFPLGHATATKDVEAQHATSSVQKQNISEGEKIDEVQKLAPPTITKQKLQYGHATATKAVQAESNKEFSKQQTRSLSLPISEEKLVTEPTTPPASVKKEFFEDINATVTKTTQAKRCTIADEIELINDELDMKEELLLKTDNKADLIVIETDMKRLKEKLFTAQKIARRRSDWQAGQVGADAKDAKRCTIANEIELINDELDKKEELLLKTDNKADLIVIETDMKRLKEKLFTAQKIARRRSDWQAGQVGADGKETTVKMLIDVKDTPIDRAPLTPKPAKRIKRNVQDEIDQLNEEIEAKEHLLLNTTDHVEQQKILKDLLFKKQILLFVKNRLAGE